MSRSLLRLRPRVTKSWGCPNPSPAFSSLRTQSTTSSAITNSTKPINPLHPQPSTSTTPSHPPPQTPITFPCLDKLELRTQTLRTRPPEPTYVTGPHQQFTSSEPLPLDHGGSLPSFTLAYETWGTLNPQKDNLLLLFTGLSASSHAASNTLNPKPGWWEKFIGPGKALDTSKYFVVCTNVLGGCFGSTGPSSIDERNGERWATRFPIVTLGDMVRAQWRLVDNLVGENKVTLVGASMGGMLSLAAARETPERVNKLVSISACARSSPYSIAMRHTQRQVLISDPHYNRGNYYPPESLTPPHIGMKLARQIATITYRSGPEWELRFGRNRADPSKPPALCPDFLIETYLDHAGEKWCLEYDANSFLYLSKAMDLFDLGHEAEVGVGRTRGKEVGEAACSIPDVPYEEVDGASEGTKVGSGGQANLGEADVEVNGVSRDLVEGMKSMRDVPALVMGVKSDILFPAWQQREIAGALKEGGNKKVKYVELGEDVSMFGHDTFLLDTVNVGEEVARFLKD